MIKLFCIPYSGGSASVYYKWRKHLDPRIELVPLEMAGRGSRMKEPFYENMKEAAKDLSTCIARLCKPDDQFAIFGHSLGSLVAFETYYALHEIIDKEPQHIFFSGRKAPQDEGIKTEFYKLPENEFMAKVLQYGGNTQEILNNQELIKLFVPILRSDFRLAERYTFEPKKRLIACPYTILSGTEDFSVQMSDLTLWSKFASEEVYYESLPGTHFFITENVEQTTNCINYALFERNKEEVND